MTASNHQSPARLLARRAFVPTIFSRLLIAPPGFFPLFLLLLLVGILGTPACTYDTPVPPPTTMSADTLVTTLPPMVSATPDEDLMEAPPPPPMSSPAPTAAPPVREDNIRPQADRIIVRSKPKPLPQVMDSEPASVPQQRETGTAQRATENTSFTTQPGGVQSRSQEQPGVWADVTLLLDLPWRQSEVLVDGAAARLVEDRGLVKYLRMPVKPGPQTITLRVAGRICEQKHVISGKKTIQFSCPE